ncbi:MAG: hypothetical protein C4297_01060 [Gemmataceae bacterium]
MKGLVVTFLLTFGGAFVSLFNPFYGLLIYICFAIVRPEAMWFYSLPQGGNYSRIVAIGMLLGWAINGFGRWQLGRATAPTAFLLSYWAWSFIGSLACESQSVGWKFFEELSKIVLPFLVGVTTIHTPRQLRMLAWTIALSQGYLAWELNLSYYRGFNWLHGYNTPGGFGGMDNNCVAIAMTAGAGLALFLGLEAGRWWHKALAFFLALLQAHTVMFAFSRGGMLALCLMALVAFLLVPKRPVHYLYFLLAVALGLRLAGPEVRERFLTTFADPEQRDASAQSRLDLWAICWDMMLDQPVLGVGPDHFPLYVDDYSANKYPEGKEAHSLWLQIGAEQGFLGLGLLVGFYLITCWRLLPFTRRHYPLSDPFYRDIARAVIAGITGFAISGQFVSLEGLELPYYIILLGAVALKLAPVATLAPAPASAGAYAPSIASAK